MAKKINYIWQLLGITVLIFISVELIFLVINKITGIDEYEINKITDRRAQADSYAHVDWEQAYFQELRESMDANWRSYVYYRRKPYSGKFININNDGFRESYENCAMVDTACKNIFLFGGSTIWGTGARDGYTIPSALNRLFETDSLPVKTFNFGESGYVSTQEINALIHEIHQDRIPDMVIFYDGINDCFSALQQKKAGIPQNEYNRVNEFNLTSPTNYKKLRKIFIGRFIKEFHFTRFAAYQYHKRRLQNENQVGIKIEYDEALVDETVRIYLQNIKIINALAKNYGFKALFFWQPSIYSKPILSAYESLEAERTSYFRSFYADATHKLVEKQDAQDIIDLQHIFKDHSAPLYIDFCHLNEEGNRLIAEKMYPIIKSALFDIPDPSQ